MAAFIAPARLLAEMNINCKFKRDRYVNYSYIKQVTDQTVINLEHLFANYIDFESQPADWFHLFFPMRQTKDTHAKAVTMDNLTTWTNTKVMMENTGSRGSEYYRFVNYNKHVIMLHLALYLLRSISPSPQVEMKFKSE